MGEIVRFPALDECRCKRCGDARRRFPGDPTQLLLPLPWPDELRLTVERASA